MNKFWEHPDLLVRTGSHLYGCNVPTSDEDKRGFVVEPLEFMLGRGRDVWNDKLAKFKMGGFEQFESKDPEPDTVIWGAKKFFKLLEGFSPNTAEILWAPKEHILRVTPAGQLLLDNKHLFVTKNLIEPMRGFAGSEWKKAVDYFEQMRKLGAQRKGHIQEFGYSIKNAYHAIRLLEECIELLETGTITFPRPNGDYLRKIRHGEIPVEEVTAHYEALDKHVEFAISASTLPQDADREKLDNLFFEMIKLSSVCFMASRYELACTGISSVISHPRMFNPDWYKVK